MRQMEKADFFTRFSPTYGILIIQNCGKVDILKILLAEDDEYLGELIVHLLKKKGFGKADWVMEGEDAYEYAKASYYDVLILDWMMPNGDGISVCRRLRREGYSGAILMLTARDAVSDRVEGLEAGADDYLIKPFEIDELAARLKALSRRMLAPLQEDVIQWKSLELNRTSHTLFLNGEEIFLTPREYQLLEMLLRNKGQVLTREMILDRIWGIESDVSMKTIDATIKLLRKKIDKHGTNSLIETIRGVGYKIEA
ncbi:transcriptional regulator [Bacillus sp. NRRL B-14911]|jgi:DNA-binding response OmpR family regulator|nr:transcriptional regulator [Bacillus sp. NRRL B-14911]